MTTTTMIDPTKAKVIATIRAALTARDATIGTNLDIAFGSKASPYTTKKEAIAYLMRHCHGLGGNLSKPETWIGIDTINQANFYRLVRIFRVNTNGRTFVNFELTRKFFA